MKAKILALFLIGATFHSNSATWNDVSRLNEEKIRSVHVPTTHSDIQDALKMGAKHNLPIVISGTKHSQGGHITHAGALVLDMSGFNKVLSVSLEDMQVKVQSGATWDQVQKAVNPFGLSVKVMQSSNIFSVGGSISANIHGRDPHYSSLIETLVSMNVALPSGDIVTASRTQNQDIFCSVVGGYGNIGVIIDATFELTENVQLEKSVKAVDYTHYWAQLDADLKSKKVELHYGRCSIVRNDTFLRDCYSINYTQKGNERINTHLVEESNIARNRFIFNRSRHSDFGKSVRWYLQHQLVDIEGETELISRNNAMRPPIRFLDYYSEKDTDILQEYFVPVGRFTVFMDEIRSVLERHDVNLLSMTLRYLPENQEATLSYATDEMIAVVLFINMEINSSSIEHAGIWTRDLVDKALEQGGTYYLTYQRFPSQEQFELAYPTWREFRALKNQFDPNHRLMNNFYKQYFQPSILPN